MSSSPGFIPFVSFPFLTIKGKSLSPILNRTGEQWHPWHSPDFTGNSLRLPFNTVLALGLLHTAFMILSNAPTTPNVVTAC